MHEQKFTCRTVEETRLKLVSYAATKESECEYFTYFFSSFSYQLVSCITEVSEKCLDWNLGEYKQWMKDYYGKKWLFIKRKNVSPDWGEFLYIIHYSWIKKISHLIKLFLLKFIRYASLNYIAAFCICWAIFMYQDSERSHSVFQSLSLILL